MVGKYPEDTFSGRNTGTGCSGHIDKGCIGVGGRNSSADDDRRQLERNISARESLSVTVYYYGCKSRKEGENVYSKENSHYSANILSTQQKAQDSFFKKGG